MSKNYLNIFKYKVKTASSLKKIKEKNKKKIILCHGVFDVVHPGHIRHFIYAKSKADILVVSCTSDKFIDKGTYRPHVPERLRALNLAALQMVDFVIIDNNKTPINLIKVLKPNYFAKGFEYNAKLNLETKEEIKFVESQGGQMIFTPGDVVFSSSKIIDNNQLKIDDEKLLSLLAHNNIKLNNLINIIKKFKKLSVHVIGDTIVDTYTNTQFIVGQTKTPTFSVLYDSEKNYIGGAAIVALHLKAAGAKVKFTSLLGNDKLKKFVVQELKKNKILTNLIIDKNRPTTNKNLIISEDYKLLKIDKLDNRPINNLQINKIIRNIKKDNSDIMILSDFRHGIFNNFNVEKICSAIPKKIFKVADSQVASRWGNITLFKDFDLITPNEREARFALADQDSTVGQLATELYKKTNCDNLILKLGSKGIFCVSNVINKNKDKYFFLNSFLNQNSLIDAVGAGDALLAYSSLSYKISGCLISSSIIGSLAASCACEIRGNQPINSSLIIDKIDELKKRLKIN